MEMKATRIVVTAAALAALPAAAAAKRPNIVLVISDDTRMLDFGCYGLSLIHISEPTRH